MLRASLLALCLTTAAGQLRGARPLGGLPRSSALQSTTDMFAFWCNTEREGSSLCQSRKRSQKLGEIQKQIVAAPKDSAERAKLMKDRTAMLAESKAHPIGSTRKEYLEMKEAYCATEPARSKVLCANPTSRYSSLQTSRGAPAAITWYCGLEANKESAECKRTAISAKLRQLSFDAAQKKPVDAEARKKLLEELKAHPFNYASMQAIQADFCKVAKHAGDSSCLRLKQTQAQSSMQEWYCAQPTSAPSTWCKRTSLLKKLHAMPAGAPGTADKAGSPERVALLQELRALSKRSGKSPGLPAYSVSKELADAKAAYCKQPAQASTAYCQAKPSPLAASRSSSLFSNPFRRSSKAGSSARPGPLRRRRLRGPGKRQGAANSHSSLKAPAPSAAAAAAAPAAAEAPAVKPA